MSISPWRRRFLFPVFRSFAVARPSPASILGQPLVRGSPVRVVASVADAREVAGILDSVSSVVAWNIEATDVDTKRFHTAGTGGRILCASATAAGVDFGNGASTVFIDAIPFHEEEVENFSDAIVQEFKQYFQDSSRAKTSHSVADDYHVLAQHGIRLGGVESDTRYLARLCNTALSSWEGVARKKMVSDEDEAAGVYQKGYDLRAAVATFERREIEFADLKIEKLLRRLNGSKLAHFSSNRRAYWIGRTAESALLTLDLRNFLERRLRESDWSCEVLPGTRSMWDLAQLVHKPLALLLAEIEGTGIGIDSEFLGKVRNLAQAEVDKHIEEFVRIASEMKNPSNPQTLLNPNANLINVHSPHHLRQLLFGYPSEKQTEWFSYGKAGKKEKIPNRQIFLLPNGNSVEIAGIGLRPIQSKMNKKRLADFSAKGIPSVNQKLLSEYASGRALEMDQLGKFGAEFATQACAMLGHLLNIGKMAYVTGSFIDPLIEKTVGSEVSGVSEIHQSHLSSDESFPSIHPSLSLDTSTGRLVCRKPNLHNPPNASDTLGVRAAFVARPGNSLLVADYSQLELRILAHVTNCESMVKALNAGGDYHSWTALEMFPEIQAAIDAGECTVGEIKSKFAKLRGKAKAVNFSIAYGKCARSIAEEMDCHLVEAEELLTKWYATKPEVAEWKSDVVFRARVTKQVNSILGRPRDIPHIDNKLWKGRSERAAVNHCIQGSAADIAISAMLQVASSPDLKRLEFRLLMQIHDEFILEGPSENAPAAQEILVDLMQNPFRSLNPLYAFKVPLCVDAGIGPNWLLAKP